MPVHKRIYARMSEPAPGAPAIPALAIAHYGSRYAMRGWFPRLVFFGAFIPCLAYSFMIYLSSADPSAEGIFRELASRAVGTQLRSGDLAPESWRELARYGFYSLLKIQTGFILLLNAFVGARLVADDVRSRAFEVYMTRPLRPVDYALGKLLVVLRPLLMITAIPLSVVFLAASVLWEGCFTASWPIFLLALLGALMMSVVNGLVILGISAMTRSARYATVMWFALYFFTMVVHGILFAATGGTSSRFDFVSYGANQHILLQKLLGLRGEHVLESSLDVAYPLLPSLLIVGGLLTLATWLILRRCRPGRFA